jgi:hypothetical protein
MGHFEAELWRTLRLRIRQETNHQATFFIAEFTYYIRYRASCFAGIFRSEVKQSSNGAVLRIHDILVWIRIRGSMPLTNGSGSATLGQMGANGLIRDPDFGLC